MPQRPMMVDLGESQVLEWQVAQAVERGVDIDGSRAHFFKQRAQLGLIHRKF
jgi:hypothetical protein